MDRWQSHSFSHQDIKAVLTPDRAQRSPFPAPGPQQTGPDQGPGPRRPDVPDTKELLRKMKDVDRRAAERYKQRQGQ
jgi:hypothetical protein